MRYLLAPFLERPTRTIDRRDLERLIEQTEEEPEDVHERPTVPRIPVIRQEVQFR